MSSGRFLLVTISFFALSALACADDSEILPYYPAPLSQEEALRFTQSLTLYTCIQYNQMHQIEANRSNVPNWKVKSEWVDPTGDTQIDILEVSSGTRFLAAGYAMCQLWDSKHIRVDRFSGFSVELVINKLDNKD